MQKHKLNYILISQALHMLAQKILPVITTLSNKIITTKTQGTLCGLLVPSALHMFKEN